MSQVRESLADVTLVVSTHDAGPGLPGTVAALEEQGDFGAVLVVDSGSADGSVEELQRRRPELGVRRLEGNPGPCATRNLGLQEAQTPLVLLVDHDMVLGEACVRRLRRTLLEDPGCVLCGPRILHAEGPDRVQYEGGLWHYAGLPHMPGAERPPGPAGVREVDVVTAGCVLARRQPVLAAGGFDEAFFFLMEDADLSLRLRYRGHRLVVDSAALAWNAGGSEELSFGDGAYPGRRLRLHARNRCLLVLGLYDAWTLLVLWPPLLLMDAAWLGFALLARRPGAFLRGRLEVLRLLPAVLRRRRSMAGCKLVKDREILGAPSLTFTESALRRPLARPLGAALDGVLRLLHVVLRRFLL